MKEMFFKSVEFREVQHLAFSDEYITAYVSVNNVPKIHMSVNTPRDEYGFAKGKPKRYFRVGLGKWLTERAFEKKYFSEE